MRLIVAALLLLNSCGPSGKDEGEAFNRAMEHANEQQPDLPRGWRYAVRKDKIRNTLDYVAAIPNEDPGSPIDQTMILVIQKLSQEGVVILFRGNGNAVGCATVCGVAYRAGDLTGSWTAERTYTGESVMLNDSKSALETILSSPQLIAEVPSSLSGQYTFKTGGLTWPPRTSSN